MTANLNPLMFPQAFTDDQRGENLNVACEEESLILWRCLFEFNWISVSAKINGGHPGFHSPNSWSMSAYPTVSV